MDCRECGHQWDKATEKETDINVALSLFDDAYRDIFDHAYLLSADSDQAATARMFKARFPNKKLTTVVPPGRPPSKSILAQTPHKIVLTRDHLERAIMPQTVKAQDGRLLLRPKEYDPPSWWVHPDDRP